MSQPKVRHLMRRWRATPLLATSLLFAGCAEPVPEPVVEAASIVPALTSDQDARILERVNAVLATADAARNPTRLSERLTGPALAVRTSQLEVAAQREDDELVTELPSTYQQIIVPTTDTWPRTMYAITDVGEALAPPRLLALEQASPRDPYKLWGWVQLRPGVAMPAFADPRVGSAELGPDDGSLRFTPREVVEQYADLLTNGDASPYVGNFEPIEEDTFRSFLSTWISAQEQALQGDRVQGIYSFTVRPLPDTEIKAVRTVLMDGTDDGALVLFALEADERLEAMEGAILTPQTMTAKALLDGATFTNILTARYLDMVALYVPPAGSTEPIMLLGYSHVQTAAGTTDTAAAPAAEEAPAEATEEPTESATEPEPTAEATNGADNADDAATANDATANDGDAATDE